MSDRNPLMPYVDSYRMMAKMGDGKVDCLSVAYDIERNMTPHVERPLMFLLGYEYTTRGGEKVRLVSIHNAGSDYETMACAAGVHRYTRRLHPLNFGRTTGTDGTDPRDLIPPTAPREKTNGK